MGIRQSAGIKIVRREIKKNISAVPLSGVGKMKFQSVFTPTTAMGEYFASSLKDMDDDNMGLGWDENILSANSHKKQYYREPEVPKILSEKHHEELKKLMNVNTLRMDLFRKLGATVEKPHYSSYRATIPIGAKLNLVIRNYEERDTGAPDFTTGFMLQHGKETLADISFGQHSYLEKYDVRYRETAHLAEENRAMFFELVEDAFGDCGKLEKLIKADRK